MQSGAMPLGAGHDPRLRRPAPDTEECRSRVLRNLKPTGAGTAIEQRALTFACAAACETPSLAMRAWLQDRGCRNAAKEALFRMA
jgi:hypothetical protein